MRLIKAASAAQLKEFYWQRPTLLCRPHCVPFHYYVKRCPRLFFFNFFFFLVFAANNAGFLSLFFPQFFSLYEMFLFFVIFRSIFVLAFFFAKTWIHDSFGEKVKEKKKVASIIAQWINFLSLFFFSFYFVCFLGWNLKLNYYSSKSLPIGK